MNIHGIRTHPPGLYIPLSAPDVLPLSHVLLLYKSAVLYFDSAPLHLSHGLRPICPPESLCICASTYTIFRRPRTAHCFHAHWQPPALPCRLQQSTIGRLSLNRRVRDGNGCLP